MGFPYDELSERKKLILKAIIDAHIENGEPVGSKYITTNKQIAYSSATIRIGDPMVKYANHSQFANWFQEKYFV